MNKSNTANYKPKDFAELLGVSVKTLQRWDREGIWKANRTPTNRRYYTHDQYLQFKEIHTYNDIRDIVKYARVSTGNQKDDLKNQSDFLRQFCNARKYKKLWRIKFPVKTDLYALAMIGLKSSAKNSILESLL